MVEIYAMIRPNKASLTKKALLDSGYPGFTCIKATGRGRKSIGFELPDGTVIQTSFVQKRLFIILIPDEAELAVVKAIVDVNSTGSPGDGKIFVVPVEKTYQVRTHRKI